MTMLSAKTIWLLNASLLIAIFAFVLQQTSLNNPELNKTIHELIELRGFKHESHFIETAQGYVLQTVRIINPHVSDRSKLKPVILHHGFQCSGSMWLIAANGTLRSDGTYWEEEVMAKDAQSVGNSLGFVLAARGYDVWLANFRGNVYSTNHTTLDPEDLPFWQFSIDEMASFDLPATIEYVKAKTGKQTVGYIGHSQGNIMMLSLLATQPHYSQSIKPYIALSPVFYSAKLYGSVNILAKFRKLLLTLRPKCTTRFAMRFLKLPAICANSVLQRYLCFYFYKSLVGATYNQMDFNRLPVYLDQLGAGASTRNFVQILQMADRVNPSYFDYEDEEENLRVYKQKSAPEYPVGNIDSKDIALIYTKNDWINHLDNIELLRTNLKVKLIDDYAVPEEDWGHNELLLAKDVGKYVNSRVLQILDKY